MRGRRRCSSGKLPRVSLPVFSVLLFLAALAGCAPVQPEVPQTPDDGFLIPHSMPAKGKVKVPAFRVSFGGTGKLSNNHELAQSLSGIGSPDTFPEEGISPYYWRASYGKLDISFSGYSYDAKGTPAYYEDDMEKLTAECLGALESDGTPSGEFDSDDDGVVDAIYIFPELDGAPSPDSPWWGHTSYAEGDGRIGSYMVIHRQPDEVGFIVSAIHETGHALGLPDLYDEGVWMEDGHEGSAGSKTFDMMDTNAGDIDGYMKHRLGWISEDEIAGFDVDSEGSGQARLASVEAGKLSGSEKRLALFTVGGKAEVAVEFAAMEGNNTAPPGLDIPEGVRIWLLDGTEMEALDLDGDKPHRVDRGFPHALDSYGCMLADGGVAEVSAGDYRLRLSCSISEPVATVAFERISSG